MSEPGSDDVELLASVLQRSNSTVAIAESLTGGALSSRLAAGPGSSDWYRGAVVSYSSAVKHDLLKVPDVPVVSEIAAVAMAESVCKLLGSDFAVAVTGAGGPEPQDGQEPGTVWIALHNHRTETTRSRLHHFPGDPDEVVKHTCKAATAWLLSAAMEPYEQSRAEAPERSAE
ncbi:MAG: CinA family protein [Microthrixaceae bacterium]